VLNTARSASTGKIEDIGKFLSGLIWCNTLKGKMISGRIICVLVVGMGKEIQFQYLL
jgi:hypothetical protein